MAEVRGKVAAREDEKLKASVSSPKFVANARKSVRDKFGDEYDLMPTWQREDAEFQEMDANIKQIYRDESVHYATYNGVQGWYSVKEGKRPKLLRRHSRSSDKMIP